MNTMQERFATSPRVLAAAPSLRSYLEPFDDKNLAALKDSWQALTSDGPFAEPFYQPEWFAAFADSFARHQQAVLLTVWGETKLRGVVPLLKCSSFFGGIPARAYRGLSGIHSCRYDVIHDQTDAHHIINLIWRTLHRDESWDVIEAEDVPAGGGFHRLMDEAKAAGCLIGVWPTRKTPVLSMPPRGGDPLQNCPRDYKSIRSRLKGKLRRLQENGDVQFDVLTSECDEQFKRFLLLESSGWKGRTKSAIASSSVTTTFYASLVSTLQKRNMLRLYSLRVGEKTIAMQLGVAMNNIYYCPKVAFDEAFAPYSPGQLLNRHVIADLCANGFSAYDFLGPRAPWKAVWTSDVREHSNCYIFRPTLRGRVLFAVTMQGAASLRRVYRKLYGDPQSIAH
jgi:hypothetical protein